MRIVFVSTGARLMGTNYRALGLAKGAVQIGLDVHYILPDLPENRAWFPEGHYGGVPIHFTRPGPVAESWDKYQILASLRPDVVHCVDVARRCFPVSLAYWATHQCQLVIDIDEHLSRVPLFNFGRRLYFRACEHFVRRYADKLVVGSRFLETWFTQSKHRPVLYLPNAVDLGSFREQQEGWQDLKSNWGGRKVITYFGSLSSHYDANIAFGAALKLLEKRQDLVFQFIAEGDLLSAFRERTKAMGLEDSILFLGFIPDNILPKHLCSSDAFIFPIRDNWWNRARCPMKVFYFMAAMAPIVTNPVGEVREALGDRAWYFKDGDTEDLIRALQECLDAVDKRCFQDDEVARGHSWLARASAYAAFMGASN